MESMERYEIQDLVGVGSFGTVSMGSNLLYIPLLVISAHALLIL